MVAGVQKKGQISDPDRPRLPLNHYSGVEEIPADSADGKTVVLTTNFIADFANNKHKAEASPHDQYALRTDLANVVRQPDIADVVRAADLVSYAKQSDIANVVRTPDLGSYVKTTDIANVVRTPDLGSYVKTTDIANVVRTPDLGGYVKTTDIANVVRTPDLGGYVKTTDIANVVRTPDLSGYVKTTDLAGYARQSDLSSKADLSNGKILVSQMPSPVLVFSSAARVTSSGAEKTLLSLAIPGGFLKANGFLEIYYVFSGTLSTNVKRLRLRMGGQIIGSLDLSGLSNANSVSKFYQLINRNNEKVQALYNRNGTISFGATSDAMSTDLAIDTTVNQTLEFLGSTVSATESINLEIVTVKAFSVN